MKRSRLLLLSAGVLFWSAGFDVIYSLQDIDFDRRERLHSLPARYGASVALRLARAFHLLAVVFLLATGASAGLGLPYFLGTALAAGLLAYEHFIVSPEDQAQLQIAFFRVNVAVALILLGATTVDLLLA